jgi:hypothetical protein
MATYLQGEQGIIPSIQPFTPDINLISNVLQQKQSQFDTNYKYLNKIYNTYVFSDLSREDNIKRRDGFVKQMDLDLKRIASLDLSEQKNVDQAVRVFAPLYEDPYLMADMAKTKNYKSRRSSAAALQTSLNKDQRSQYWGEGVRYMDYMMEDFKSMSLEETLSSPDITYTPYVNVAQKLSDIAKAENLNVEVDTFTKDGLYIVTDKNGSLLVDPLTRLFSQTIANDPAIQDIYKVRAYVKRKDSTYANQERLGSLEAAEQDYLIGRYNELNAFAQQWNEQNNRDLNDKEHTVKQINKSYKDGTYNDKTEVALQEQEQSKARIQNEVNQSSGLVEELSDGQSSTLATAKEAENITGNINLLRNVVDSGMSTLLMQQDIVGAAQAYAIKDVKHKINVNPVGLENLRHAHRNSEIDRRAAKNEKALVLKNNLDSGVWVSDMYGNVAINPELTARLTKTVTTGTSTGAQNAPKINRQYETDLANQKASPAVNMMFEYLENEVAQERMSPEQAGAFFSYKGKTLQEVKAIYEKTPGTFFTTRGFSVEKTMKDFMRYAQTNKKGDAVVEAMVNSPEFASLNEYASFAGAAKKVRNQNLDIARKIISEGVYEAGLANDYNILSKDLLVNLTSKERQLLNKKLPEYFITNLSGPVTQAGFKRAVLKDKELAKIIQKIDLTRRLERGPMQGNIGSAGTAIATKLLGDMIGGSDNYLERVYETYAANWDTKKNSTKFKTYYVGDYVPGENGSEYALSAPETNGLTVFPNAYGTPNRTVWTELMADVNNMSRSLANPKDAKISFGGLGKEASNNTQAGLAVLSYLNSKMAGKEKPKNFEIYSAQIAMEDPKKGAMIIYPNAEDLDKLVGTKNEPGIITADERNKILRNGISIVGDRNSFNNFLMKEGNVTPMQAVVNAGGYEYVNPGGAGNFKITRSGDSYNVTGTVNARNSNSGQMETQYINQPSNFGGFGNNLDSYIQQLQQNLIAVNQQNNNIYRKFNPVNQ